jgi:hypothetical protein
MPHDGSSSADNVWPTARFHFDVRWADGTVMRESGGPAMVWTLANARPNKLTGTDLNPSGDQWALATIELTHEGMTIAQP